MKTLIIKATGKTVVVENNIAHGMIERGEAFLPHSKSDERRLKEMTKPPKDKMIHGTSHIIKKK